MRLDGVEVLLRDILGTVIVQLGFYANSQRLAFLCPSSCPLPGGPSIMRTMDKNEGKSGISGLEFPSTSFNYQKQNKGMASYSVVWRKGIPLSDCDGRPSASLSLISATIQKCASKHSECHQSHADLKLRTRKPDRGTK